MIKKEMIERLICEAFRDMEFGDKYEIGEGYYMVFYDGNDDGEHIIGECGVAVGTLDADGDFDFDGEETGFYLLEDFYDTFDEFFTNGNKILENMAGKIAADFGWEY